MCARGPETAPKPGLVWYRPGAFSELSREQFQERYLKAEKPVIITGLCDRWPAMRNWRLDSLFSGRYRNCRLKVGEDDDGNSIRVKLKYFLNYLAFNQDDSPMYLFDCSFDERDTIAGLIDDYEVPFYFRDDLFQFVSEKRRPHTAGFLSDRSAPARAHTLILWRRPRGMRSYTGGSVGS